MTYVQQYKLVTPIHGDLGAASTINSDGSYSSFLFAEDNPDYQAYLAWLAEGNTPLEADAA